MAKLWLWASMTQLVILGLLSLATHFYDQIAGGFYCNGCICFHTVEPSEGVGGLLFNLCTNAFSKFSVPEPGSEVVKILELQGCLSAVDMSDLDSPIVLKADNTGAWRESITLPSHEVSEYGDSTCMGQGDFLFFPD